MDAPKIRDRAFYDSQHDGTADQRHLAAMERDALYLLEGIRRKDQNDPEIARAINARAKKLSE